MHLGDEIMIRDTEALAELDASCCVSGWWATCSRPDPIKRRVAEDLRMQLGTAGCGPQSEMLASRNASG